MPTRLSEEEVNARFSKREPEYYRIGEYKNVTTKVKIRHRCGYEYFVMPSKFWGGDMCPKCNHMIQVQRQREDGARVFIQRLKATNMELCEGEVYAGQKSKVKVRCLRCGRIQCSWASNILSGHGCKSCQNSRPLSREEFMERLINRAPDWELIGNYSTAKKPTLFRHKKCGKTFIRMPGWVVTHPNQCNRCSRSAGESSLVDAIVDLLPADEEFRLNDRTVLSGKELDLYLPCLQVGVEYNGLYYHSDSVLRKKGWNPIRYHLEKSAFAKQKGVRLLHVFEDEWREHPEIVLDKIRSILKLPLEQRYMARKMILKEIKPNEARVFLDTNHIQGRGGCTISIGLYNNDELIAVQTFAKVRDGRTGEFELTRYATRLGCQVVGGFSKCLAYFEQVYKPVSVLSFADRRWCEGGENVYAATGFALDGVVPPNYWYVKGEKRYHKFNFRKNLIAKKLPEVYDPNKTERQMMQEAGYHRIYDCGLLRYKKNYL